MQEDQKRREDGWRAMLRELFKSLFIPKSLEDEVWDSVKKRKQKMAEVFTKVLKLRVPGYSGVYLGSKMVVLEFEAPLPGYESGSSVLCFESKRSMRVMHARSSDGIPEIFEACLGACQYSDLVVDVPPDLTVFYGKRDIVVFKRGETLESLAIEADLNCHQAKPMDRGEEEQ